MMPVVDSIDFTLVDASMSGWFNTESKELLKGFDVLPSHHVLDAGCGDGQFTHFCAKMGAEVTYADISSEKVEATTKILENFAARKFHPLVTDGNPFPVGDAEFDRIIAMEVLEHVDSPKAFLQELVRVGKPGARYLITVPDANSESVQQALAPAIHFQRPNHIHIFSRDEFAALIEEAGLVIEQRHFYGFYWAVWWAFFWLCNVDLGNPDHPLLSGWARTWEVLLGTPGGERVKNVLDTIMPKSQAIIAFKP